MRRKTERKKITIAAQRGHFFKTQTIVLALCQALILRSAVYAQNVVSAYYCPQQFVASNGACQRSFMALPSLCASQDNSSQCLVCEEGLYLTNGSSSCTGTNICGNNLIGRCVDNSGQYCASQNGSSPACTGCSTAARGSVACSASYTGQELIVSCKNGFIASQNGNYCVCSIDPSSGTNYMPGITQIWIPGQAEVCTQFVQKGQNYQIPGAPVALPASFLFMSAPNSFTYDSTLNMFQAQSCLSGLYLDPNRSLCFSCSTLVVGCALCTTDGSECLQCAPGYQPTPPKPGLLNCTPCAVGCATCDDSGYCYSVYQQSNYFLSNHNPVVCNSTSVMTCTVNSNGSVLLTRCNNGYYAADATSSAICLPITVVITNCMGYSGPTICSFCLNGYGLVPDGQSCLACPANQAYCTITGSPGSYTFFPQTCVPGYGSTGSDCVPCTNIDLNCLICSFIGELINGCQLCASGYIAINGSCVSCSQANPNCIECTDATHCTRCAYGYSVQNYNDPTYGGLGQCILCKNYATLNCASCFLDINFYYPIPPNWLCLQCLPGFGLTPANNCLQCIQSNCQACTFTGSYVYQSQCTSCATGYTLKNDACVKNTPSQIGVALLQAAMLAFYKYLLIFTILSIIAFF